MMQQIEINRDQRRLLFSSLIVMSVFLALLLVLNATLADEVSTMIKTIDGDGDVGKFTAIALTSEDAPVISYFDAGNDDLKVAVCDNVDCENPVIKTLDSDGLTGTYSSIAITADEIPVISYYDRDVGDLNLAVCDDPKCSGATIVPIDQPGNVGQFTSLVLNEDGFPVISYYDVDNTALKIAVCDDLLCSSSTIETVDDVGTVGQYSSLQLNDQGFPVISYYDALPNKDLKIAFCDDEVCSNPTIETLVQAGDAGKYSSLLLWNSIPYVAFLYEDFPGHTLNLVACLDPACAASVDGTIELEKYTGEYVSLALNHLNQLVLSYWNDGEDELRVMTCPEMDIGLCFLKITYRVDRVGNSGSHTDMVLNSAGEPVISYYSMDQQALKLATCLLCRVPLRDTFEDVITTEDTMALALSNDDKPYLTYYNFVEGEFNLTSCHDMACSSSTITPLENGLMTYPSMVMQKDNGFPLIAYHHAADNSLKIMVCGNEDCSANLSNTIAPMGTQPSMKLNSSGLPVISYFDKNTDDLIIAYCESLLCAAPVFKTIADAGLVGGYSSLVLREDDTPAVSYYDATNATVMLALCSNPQCDVVHDKAVKPDSGPYNALGLRNDSTLAVFYYDQAAGELWQMTCDFPSCAGVPLFSLVDDTGNDLGQEVALAMSDKGLPLLAYHDGEMKEFEFARIVGSAASRSLPKL